MPSPSTRSLHDLAVSRLTSLFGARFVSELIEPKPANRCKVRGCVYPLARDNLCRRHFLDQSMEASAMPSSTGAAINGYDHTVSA